MSLTPEQMVENHNAALRERLNALPEETKQLLAGLALKPEIRQMLANRERSRRPKIIPIVVNYDHTKVIGMVEDGIVTIAEGQRITLKDAVSIFGSVGYKILEFFTENDTMYLRKFEIEMFSLYVGVRP